MPASPLMTKPAEKPRRSGPALLLALILGLGLAGGVGGAAWWYMSQTELKLAEDIDDADATEDADSAESPMPMRADAPTGAPVGTLADTPSPAPTPAPTPPQLQETQPSAAERALEVTVTAQPQTAVPATTPEPAREGYALAARSYVWVLKSKCPTLPEGEHWRTTKHTDLVRQVNRQYGGDWQPYIRTWVDRLSKLQEIYRRNSGVKLGNGEVLAGEKLRAYIEQTQKRLDVTICLSREAADYAHRKSSQQR